MDQNTAGLDLPCSCSMARNQVAIAVPIRKFSVEIEQHFAKAAFEFFHCCIREADLTGRFGRALDWLRHGKPAERGKQESSRVPPRRRVSSGCPSCIQRRTSGEARMEIIPDKRKLIGLVEQAHTGKLCLPNFQRDFVWPREEVADLLRSVVRRYFIGSLLLLRCDPQKPPFAPIFLRGADPEYKKARPELLVLDGQQRLTALLYALTARGPTRNSTA